MICKDKIKKLKDIFERYSKIKIVYLFGSHADNRENRFSDIDMGILLEEPYNRTIKLDILGDLATEGFCDVDLVILNEAALLLQFEVVKHNKIIYKREDFDAPAFFSITVRKYLDFKPFIETQRQYLKERILNG